MPDSSSPTILPIATASLGFVGSIVVAIISAQLVVKNAFEEESNKQLAASRIESIHVLLKPLDGNRAERIREWHERSRHVALYASNDTIRTLAMINENACHPTSDVHKRNDCRNLVVQIIESVRKDLPDVESASEDLFKAIWPNQLRP